MAKFSLVTSNKFVIIQEYSQFNLVDLKLVVWDWIIIIYP